MKTMMMGGAAIAAAMLMGAAPAAAQQRPTAQAKADPDAVCLIAITITLSQYEKNVASVPDEAKATVKFFEGALHFYSGRIAARYTEAQFGPVMRAGYAEYNALPASDKPKRSADCTIAEGDTLKAIANAIGG
ncbi:hypothetical protein OF829_17015 [Sphingomonas sp. LB-2]|uniref:hypothetical protein n=1 Tax=Sphingomonas caeni TaxID=2984949 RepID=UPI00222FA0AF|nr:hypothetical protein [Sphingomonas caeni]MCW3848941.1 hypothetical protein [Sphingomonas caeni]